MYTHIYIHVYTYVDSCTKIGKNHFENLTSLLWMKQLNITCLQNDSQAVTNKPFRLKQAAKSFISSMPESSEKVNKFAAPIVKGQCLNPSGNGNAFNLKRQCHF